MQKFAPGTKIMIIEDDKFISGLVTRKLVSEGCTVSYLESGEGAFEEIVSEQPTAILLDIMFPGKIGGFEVLERLKADSRTAGIPVIIFSNLGDEKDIQRGMALGASSYLIKASIDIEDIAGEVKKAIGA